MKYKVLVNLNLRTTPNPNRGDNIVLLIRKGSEVEGLRIQEEWLQCKFGSLIGWVKMKHDETDYVEKIEEVLQDLKPIILPTKQVITSLTPQWAFSINDVKAPTKDPHDIIKYLQVKTSPRYKRRANDTYCNVYAHDFAHLYGAYVPRVWWLNDKIQDKVQYAETVKELTANELNNWFDKFGEAFGWVQTTDLDLLQTKVNEGTIGIISTGRPLPRPAHITVVVPETDTHKAIRKHGKVTIPLQSQAGAVNYEYMTQAWYLSPRQTNPTFWYYDNQR